MNTLSIWKDFIANRKPNQQQFEHTGILVILQKCSFPQPIYARVALGEKLSKDDMIASGFVYDENGLLEREGRVFLSDDMVKIRDWANKWDIDYSFYPKSRYGCFFTSNRKKNKAYAEFRTHNNNVIMAVRNFPLKDAIIKTVDLSNMDDVEENMLQDDQ
jgi:hypothetical protein